MNDELKELQDALTKYGDHLVRKGMTGPTLGNNLSIEELMILIDLNELLKTIRLAKEIHSTVNN